MTTPGIRAEWEPLQTVYIHRPDFETRLGMMEPFGSLFERAFSYREARYEHEHFEHVLAQHFGLEVHLLVDEIVEAAKARPEIRDKLVERAREPLRSLAQRRFLVRTPARRQRRQPPSTSSPVHSEYAF